MDLKERLSKIIEAKMKLSGQDNALNNAEIEKLKNTKIETKTIALIEPHSAHGEVYPSIIKYFLDLGFSVHLFTTISNKETNSLKRCLFDKNKVKEFYFSKIPVSEEFFDLLREYEYIFDETLLTMDGYYFILQMEEKFIKKYNKNNVFVFCHDILGAQKTQNPETRFLDAKKTFVLKENIKYKDKILPYLYPIYFGDVKIKKEKNNLTNFIAVGGANKENLRNFALLFEAVDKLIDDNLKFKLTIICVTKDRIEKYLNEKNKNYIETIARVDFETLFTNLENSDYIMFNIDKDCIEYEKYKTYGVTGTLNLCLAFEKPAIIYDELEDSYNLKNCAISYGKNLYQAMKKATELNNLQYGKMQANIRNLKETYIKNSLMNLKEMLSDKKGE